MITTVLVVTSAALAWYFPLAFFFRSEWNSNSPGRSQMVFSLIVALVLTLAVGRRLGWEIPTGFRAAVYGAIVIGLAVQAVTLTKVQNRRSDRLAREREFETESVKEHS